MHALIQLFAGKAKTQEELYETVYKYSWTDWLRPEDTFAIRSRVHSKIFKDSQYVSLKVKDAIVDKIRDRTGKRPDINKINPYIENCKKANYEFHHYPQCTISFEQNRMIVANSEVAPTITGRWQKVNGYVPCRIFKNISYGKLGITNSKTVEEIMEGNVICNSSDQLLDDHLSMDTRAQKRMFRAASKLIAEKHTFLNRAKTILSVF